MYAAGTLSASAPASSNVALFAEATGETPALFVGCERPGRYGVRAAVNQVRLPRPPLLLLLPLPKLLLLLKTKTVYYLILLLFVNLIIGYYLIWELKVLSFHLILLDYINYILLRSGKEL